MDSEDNSASVVEEVELPSLDQALAVFEEAPAEEADEAEQAVEAEAAASLPVPVPIAAPDDSEQRILSRVAEKERDLQYKYRAEREKLDQERAQLEAQLKRVQEWEEWERKLAEQDVVGALESRGWKIEELAQSAVDNRPAAPVRRIEAELRQAQEATKRELDALRAQLQQEKQAQLRQRADVELRTQIKARSPLLDAVGETAALTVWDMLEESYNSGQPANLDTLVPEAESLFLGLIENALKVPEIRAKFMGGQVSNQAQAKPAPTLSKANASQVTTRTQNPTSVDDLPKEAAIDALFSGGSLFR